MLLSFGKTVSAAVIPSGYQDCEVVNAGDMEKKETLAAEKRKELGIVENSSARTTTWSYLPSSPRNYVCYTQLEDYFCIPACVQSVLMYLNGSAPSQYIIAEDLDVEEIDGGGKFCKIRPYLNEKQYVNYYVQKDYTISFDTMKTDLYQAITLFQAPAILGIVADESNWEYQTSGHVLTLAGARDDKAMFEFADPLMKRLNPSQSDRYQKIASVVYTVLTAKSKCGYIY